MFKVDQIEVLKELNGYGKIDSNVDSHLRKSECIRYNKILIPTEKNTGMEQNSYLQIV